MNFILRLILSLGLNAGFFWFLSLKYADLIAPFIGGGFTITAGWRGYVFLTVIFSILNAVVKPILALITFPFRWITFGLVHIFINAFMLVILEWSVRFLQVENLSLNIYQWQTYIAVGLILGLFNTIIHSVGKR
jgi:putative membrane protein